MAAVEEGVRHDRVWLGNALVLPLAILAAGMTAFLSGSYGFQMRTGSLIPDR